MRRLITYPKQDTAGPQTDKRNRVQNRVVRRGGFVVPPTRRQD